MSGIDVATLAGSGLFGRRVTDRYQEFMTRALAFGITVEQAETLLKSDGLVISISGRQGSAEARLEYYACYGYLTVLLGEVLTREELAEQAFPFETVLNSVSWMDRRYARHFSEMERDRQRGLVKAAIELALQAECSLERAMAAVMPYLEVEQ